jgi:hypothetical protein
MRIGLIVVVAVVVFSALVGCRSGGLLSALPSIGNDKRIATQTKGGEIELVITTPAGEIIEVKAEQPSNADAPAMISYIWPDGSQWIEITTGSSRPDESAQIWANAGQYDLFIYIGAAVFIVGLGLLIVGIAWVPIIPKSLSIMIMASGILTAYMTTILEDYGWVFLALALAGGTGIIYHWIAAKKDPIEFDRKKKKEIQDQVTQIIKSRQHGS